MDSLEEERTMKMSVKRILSILLTASVFLSLSSCKKDVTPPAPVQKTVGENTPYYSVKETELIPDYELAEDFHTFTANSTEIVGDCVLISYGMTHYPTREEFDLYEEYSEQGRWDELYNLQRSGDKSVLLIFDMDGKQLGKLPLGDNLSVNRSFDIGDGQFLAVVENSAISSVERYKLLKFNQEGNILEASFLQSDDNPTWSCEFEMNAEGNLITVNYDAVYCFNQKGEILWKSKLDTNDTIGYVNKCYNDNGNWYVNGYIHNEDYTEESVFLQRFDDKTGSLFNEKIPISQALASNIFTRGSNCYFAKDNGIYTADLMTFKEKEVLDWYWADYNQDKLDFTSLVMTSSGGFRFLSSEFDTEGETWDGSSRIVQKTSVVEYKKEEKNPYAGKPLITLGVNEFSLTSLHEYICRYNTKENSPARIQIKDYRSFTEEELVLSKSYKVADRIYQEMASGDGPDILVNFSGYSQFNTENVLLDLNTFIDGQQGLNREEYFDNVFRAFETKGKLFQVPVCVEITGFLANRELIGERTGWTFTEFEQVVSQIPKDVTVLFDIEHMNLLSMLLSNSMNTFVDYEKKEVYFDSDEFKQILSMAKTYGINDPDEATDSTNDGFSDDRFAYDKLDEGKVALVGAYLYDVNTFSQNKGLCGGKAIYVGYPSADGTGMSARPTLTMAISAGSSCKEQDWDFIRYLFDESEQEAFSESQYCIPMNRKALDYRCKREIERRAQILKENPEFSDGLKEISPEDVEGLKGVVENISTINTVDMDIFLVIEEEASRFFRTETDIEEVCTKIQQRTSEIIRNRK